jgi:uncharacterized protein (TIGR01319 family)
MLALLGDIGSTYTKLAVVNLTEGSLVARVQVPTQRASIAQGVQVALEQLRLRLRPWPEFAVRRAASSAAGGLRLVAVGLVPELTGEAARLAALGAGARVLRVFGHRLQDDDLRELGDLRPDIVLLAGGTDGGDREVLLENAGALAAADQAAAVVVAGNREVAPQAADILRRAGKDVEVADNVMPRLGELAAAGARDALRRLFLQRIVQAKGLNAVEAMFGQEIMPTPAAVLAGLELLAQEWGELLAVDVGGATTDIYSVADGLPQDDRVLPVGLRPPRALRTVEGDLGMRISADSTLRQAMPLLGRRAAEFDVCLSETALSSWGQRLAREPDWLPQSEAERRLEALLARSCVTLGVERHVGRVEVMATPYGKTYLLHGKDLRSVNWIIGSGGVLRYHPQAGYILQGALANDLTPQLMKPEAAMLLIDRDYVLAAAGLLADTHPAVALELIKRSLQPVSA